jgi:hypothetical protein
MIFWNVPSVGQLKPETLFGSDDHFGFLQTLSGVTYDANVISKLCSQYYGKANQRYWGQIITLVNYLGLKRLDEEQRFAPIPAIESVAKQYDNGNQVPAEMLFNYLLCQWQHPHPILTMDRHARQRPIVKPYAVLLATLKVLYEIRKDQAYLSNDEFYWLGYHYENGKDAWFSVANAKTLAKEILSLRQNGGWAQYWKMIDEKKPVRVHLSYPRGFLRNSYILTDSSIGYPVESSDFFIGLKPNIGAYNLLNVFIKSSEQSRFNAIGSRGYRDVKIAQDYTQHLYNKHSIGRWSIEVGEHVWGTQMLEPGLWESTNSERNGSLNPNNVKRQNQLERLAVLDKDVITRRRTEQYLLREYLFDGADNGNCAICSKRYPISFIAAAHIKQRAKCTEEEKRDIHVVMPACHLGCDRLFESGYIVIRKGMVIAKFQSAPTTPSLVEYMRAIDGRKCDYYNDKNDKYFKAHDSE